MWTDDHDPPAPTSQWKPGQTIEYTRTVFVPVYPYLGEATVEVGLYQATASGCRSTGPTAADRDRARLQGRRRSSCCRQSENIFLINKGGWHPAEFARRQPDASSGSGRRRPRSSRSRTRRRTSTFYLDSDARTDLFSDHPQQVTVYSAEARWSTSFAADNGAPDAAAHPDHRGPARHRPTWPNSGSRSTRRSCRRKLPAGGQDDPRSWASASFTRSSKPDK